MAALRQSSKLLLRSRHIQRRYLTTSRALLAPQWNEDWKPDDYPETAEARAESARKYGLIPQDYKPIPDDGAGAGDYPDLPYVGDSQKDPYRDWDDPSLLKDFGEPLHIQHINLLVEKNDPGATHMPSIYTRLALFISVFGGILLLGIYTQRWPKLVKTWDKSYPYSDFKGKPRHYEYYFEDGVKRNTHYSFEPAD